MLRERVKSRESVMSPLLDSSLIIPTKITGNKKYNFKLVICGDYLQLYKFNKDKLKKDINLEKDKEKNIDINYLFKEANYSRKEDKKIIEYKNIMRSKFQLQRLVKSNENVFKTFITLTFKENIKDIKYANKKFDIWRTKIKSTKKDFLYVCVPEFQKRGAIHYHLLTNLDIKENPNLIIPQNNKKNQYDVKYWSYGFTSVFAMQDINVVGYISKYMTKDIDNRLWGHRRYLSSRDLIQPIETYLDLDNDLDFVYLLEKISETNITYKNQYLDYFGDTIDFIEYKNNV